MTGGRAASLSVAMAARRSAPCRPLPAASSFGGEGEIERPPCASSARAAWSDGFKKEGKAMKSNAVIENILDRRSVRAFTEEPVSREDLEAVVTCGQWAPSAMNRQEWCFVVVDDAEKIARLAETMRVVLGRDAYDMYRPAAIVLVGHVKGASFGREDDGCAMQTMMLAAHSLGLGSVWYNQLQGICDESAVRTELDALGLPGDHEVHGICALGHAAAPGKAHERTSQVVWAN